MRIGDLASSSVYGGGLVIVYSRFEVGLPGTVNWMEISTFSGSGSINLGIYTNAGNFPANLLAQGEIMAAGAGVWRATLPDTSLPAGTYWLASLHSGGIWRRSASTTQNHTRSQVVASYGPLPVTAAAPTGDGGSFGYTAMRAGYCFATPTPTSTPTSTETPTATVTFTATPSATASVSPSITPTATETFTPGFRVSGVGKAALGPVPARVGRPLCLHFESAPLSSEWTVFNAAGERAATLKFGAERDHCLGTTGLAPGVYFAVGALKDAAGERIFRQKLVLLP